MPVITGSFRGDGFGVRDVVGAHVIKFRGRREIPVPIVEIRLNHSSVERRDERDQDEREIGIGQVRRFRRDFQFAALAQRMEVVVAVARDIVEHRAGDGEIDVPAEAFVDAFVFEADQAIMLNIADAFEDDARDICRCEKGEGRRDAADGEANRDIEQRDRPGPEKPVVERKQGQAEALQARGFEFRGVTGACGNGAPHEGIKVFAAPCRAGVGGEAHLAMMAVGMLEGKDGIESQRAHPLGNDKVRS